MRIVYLGTPDFAVNVLKSLVESPHEVVGVVCQPDRVNGRKNKIKPGAVKTCALNYGLNVYQFENISKEGEETLRGLAPDVMVTCAYGQILKQNILDICPIYNVHASLLPKYRGSSPVQWALINGEEEVGVTIMKTELGVDTGEMLLQESIKLNGSENSEETLSLLSDLGAKMMVKALNMIGNETVTYVKQNEEEATHCRMLTKNDGIVDFSLDAKKVKNFIRGVNPWPSAQTKIGITPIKILRADIAECIGGERNGEVIVSDPKKGMIVKCGEGYLDIKTIQAEGGKPMDIKAYLLGHKVPVGSVLG